jgi:two-component system, NarL family, nitrate/nitrite response regulator NarL
MQSNQPIPFPVRVLVADSSVIHTELLARAVAKDRRIRVVNISSNGSELRKAVPHSAPDILLISEVFDQRPAGGLEIISETRNILPALKSIVLLDSPKQESVIQAFRAGARGIFCRNQPFKMLCKCIFAVNDGQIWANTQELGFLLEALATLPSLPRTSARGLNGLSERERDVIRCLGQGLSNREIAQQLVLSQHTVKNYMFRIFEKLGVSSRVELLFFVLSRSGEAQDALSQPSKSSNEIRTKPATICNTRPPKASLTNERTDTCAESSAIRTASA